MADFAVWASACETGLWPAGTFSRAYAANRKAAMDDIIEADPTAAWVRAFMADRSSWTGTAADLLRLRMECGVAGTATDFTGRPKSPRGFAGRLRRAQTFLRALGICAGPKCGYGSRTAAAHLMSPRDALEAL